jgi:hypothetical protein
MRVKIDAKPNLERRPPKRYALTMLLAAATTATTA